MDRIGFFEIFGFGLFRILGSGVFKGIKEVWLVYVLMFFKDGLNIWCYWNVESEKYMDSFDDMVVNVRLLF